MRTKKELLQLANQLPDKPGCYLMKNKNSKVIYVGKAKNLKKRVASYFNESAKSPKTEVLVSHIHNIEFLIAENEAGAFVLENNLIKKHAPRYNIRMRDDKSYPYVVVDFDHGFPRLEYQRKPNRKGKKQVFGPFVDGSRIGQVLKILTKSFQLRDCTNREFSQRKEPCLLYQMKQCSAPCVDYIDGDAYARDLDQALNFFKGKGDASLKILEDKMRECADKEEFERAAILRDSIDVLEHFISYQQELSETHKGQGNRDFIGFHVGEDEVDISIYMLRNGMILGHKNFNFLLLDAMEDIQDELLNYVLQYYTTTQESAPKEIVIDVSEKRRELLQHAFDEILEDKIKVKKKTKTTEGFMQLTKENAKETQATRVKNQASLYQGLIKLADLLNMKERPQVIECYDVAIFQGASPTASQVVFVDGKPDKSRYRYYHLQERPEGNNDFAMMQELMRRRLDNGDLPDVIIVDGGVAQVNTVKKVLEEFKMEIPVCGIAKSRNLTGVKKFQQKDIERSDERLVIPNRSNPYILSKTPSLMRIVVQLRDEAHRFSRKLHHKQEKWRTFHSWLDVIPGIGESYKKQIQTRLIHSKEELAAMNLDQIMRTLGIPMHIARKLKKHLSKSNS